MARNNNNKLKAFVRFDGSGRIIPSSLIVQAFKPAVGNYVEIDAKECCNYVPTTTTTTTAYPAENCIEFVVDTTDGTGFTFSFNTTGPINFTIDWGDGTTHPDVGGGGFYEETHTYPEIGQQYTARICFDSPESVLQLDFNGMAAVITSITGLQNLPNLTDFNADFNGLQSVNLSGLTNLLYVDISDNDIPGIFNPSLTSVNLTGCTALLELRLDDSDFSAGIPSLTGLTNLSLIDFDQCSISGVVDLSGLPALADLDFGGNTALTSIIIADTQPIIDFDADTCALTETAVDDILVVLSNNGESNGYASLDGGTNAVPSATGLAAKLVLEGNLWGVDVNV